MKSHKCQECGFVGWATAGNCKSCGAELTSARTSNSQPSPAYRVDPNYHRTNSSGDVKKGLAVCALVLGIINVSTAGLLGVGAIVGIVLSAVALKKIKQNPLAYGGRELATAGLVTSILSVAMIVPIGIVAAIAIPNLLASRRAANEGATISVLRKIHSAEATYQATVGNGEFGTLDQLAAERLIDPALARGVRFGYRVTIDTRPASYESYAKFQAVCVPETYGSSGLRSFYIDESGVIRAGDTRGAAATELTPPLNNEGYSSSSPPSRYDSRGDN